MTTDDRLRCLPQLRKVIANFPEFSEKQFVKAACALNANIPPLVSRSGRVRAQDCTHCWQFAHQEHWGKEHEPVLKAGFVLCSIAQSQSSTKRLNSVLKLVAGDWRWKLNDKGLADEVLLRTVGPKLQDAEDLIQGHSAHAALPRPQLTFTGGGVGEGRNGSLGSSA